MTSNTTADTLLIDQGQTSRTLVQLWNDSLSWIVYHSVEVAIAAGIASAIFFLLLFIRRIATKLCQKEDQTGWRLIIGRAVSKTGTFFMVMVSAKLVAGFAEAPPLVLRVITFLFTISAVLQFAVWLREIILGMIERRASADDYQGEAIGNAMGIIRLLVTFAVFAIALVVVLDNLGVNITGLVAGLGIGGIAIGMAAKGVFEDLFAALSILFDKPFRRGDSIRWDATSGTVESIGLKTTRIRSITGEEVVVSNANLLNKEVHNQTRQHRRRFVIAFGLIYQTPQEMLAHVPDIVREIVEAQKKCRVIRCGITGLGASSLDHEVQFDVLSSDYDVAYAARSAICIALLQRFAQEGIEFAYPTQTTFTAAPDGQMIMPYTTHEIEAPKRTDLKRV